MGNPDKITRCGKVLKNLKTSTETNRIMRLSRAGAGGEMLSRIDAAKVCDPSLNSGQAATLMRN